MSTIALGYLALLLIAIPVGLSDVPTMTLILIGVVLGAAVLLFNRLGWVTAAGILFVLLIEAQVAYEIVSAGQLDVIYIPLFSLLAMGLLIGVSVLPPALVFLIATANTIFVIADVNLQPATPAVQAILDSPDRYTLIFQPVALFLITSVVSYLWVRGTLQEARRANRAEEIAALEHTLADQKRQLDVGIQQILQTHVRAANGDFTARAPLGQDNLLWQIASSLNNLLTRLQRSGQDTFQLRRTNQEAQRLSDAIDVAQAGRKPVWPAPSGTAIDLILERIRGGRRSAPQPVVQEQPPASQPMSGFPGGPRSGWPDAVPQQMPPAQGGASGWPDQMAPAQQPMEPAQNGGWPGQQEQQYGQQSGQQNAGWPAPADEPTGDPGAQEANPCAFPQDDR